MTQVELEKPLYRPAIFGGLTAVLRQILDVGAQVYSVPADATLFRLMGGIRIR
jgi:fatty acid/phospholipid biosynthesis enzyme